MRIKELVAVLLDALEEDGDMEVQLDFQNRLAATGIARTYTASSWGVFPTLVLTAHAAEGETDERA